MLDQEVGKDQLTAEHVLQIKVIIIMSNILFPTLSLSLYIGSVYWCLD